MRVTRMGSRRQRGFTLVELMVVMVILVLLAGVVSVVIISRVDQAKHAKAVADIDSLGTALDNYRMDNGKYPATEQGLEALRTKPQGDDLPNWNGPYIKKPVTNDPWGAAYIYTCPGQHNLDSYDLYSLGRTGKEGGTGNDAEITNW